MSSGRKRLTVKTTLHGLIMDAEEVFLKTSFEEKNNIYERECVKLAENSLIKALDKSNLGPGDIDFIIRSSNIGSSQMQWAAMDV